MHNLPEIVESEFKKGNFVVKRSKQKFNQVDADQAMEWVNGTGKKAKGIVGITKSTSALYRWILSYNSRSHIATETHEMFGLAKPREAVHKEETRSRQLRDNKDENSVFEMLQRVQIFASTCPDTLQNIVSKDLATEEIQGSLREAKQFGMEAVATFVSKRMIIPDDADKPIVAIHDTMQRTNPRTFEYLYDVPSNTKDKGKNMVLKADRTVLQRLITSYEAGRPVNLQDVMKHELLPVPIALA